MDNGEGSFYRTIHHQFGERSVRSLKLYALNNKKWASSEERKTFLVMCRRNSVFPNYLNNLLKYDRSNFHTSNPNYVKNFEKIINHCKEKLLNLDIKTAFSDIEFYKSNTINMESLARNQIPDQMFNNFKTCQNNFFHKHRAEKRRKMENKLRGLIKEYTNFNYLCPKIQGKGESVINLTDKEIPAPVINALSLGPKFTLPSKGSGNDIIVTIANIESYLDNITDIFTKGGLRSELSNILTNFMYKNWNTPQKGNEVMRVLKNDIKDSKLFLNENKDILVLRSDKGNKTVIIPKVDYMDKMMNLLEDPGTYNHLKSDPTNKIQVKLNSHVKDLVDLGEITKEKGIFLKSYNGHAPCIYGLPKIHKEGNPLRPVVSCLFSPTYNLAKYMARILNTLRSENIYSVRDSFTFKQKIAENRIPPGFILVSLDAKSLFTTIPQNQFIAIVRKKWDLIKKDTNIPMGKFVEILEFLCSTGYFVYEEKYYAQKHGFPMGHPLSSVGADIVMGDVLKDIVNSLQFKLPFLFLFVDDIFTAIPENSIDYVLDTFNEKGGINTIYNRNRKKSKTRISGYTSNKTVRRFHVNRVVLQRVCFQ